MGNCLFAANSRHKVKIRFLYKLNLSKFFYNLYKREKIEIKNSKNLTRENSFLFLHFYFNKI